MPGVFGAEVTGEKADGLQPCVSLRDRGGLARPSDGAFGADLGFTSLGSATREAAQQILRILEFEAGGAADSEIALDNGNHTFTSGQGWATCLSSATSTLA